MTLAVQHGPFHTIVTPTQIERAIMEVDQQLATHKNRTIVSNDEFVDALLDIRLILDAYWVVWS